MRPLSSLMPGLQFSYNFVYGKANIDTLSSDFQINLFYVSSESKYHVATFQYYKGKGDQKGKLVGQDGKSFENDGYSAFGEFKIPDEFIFLNKEKDRIEIGLWILEKIAYQLKNRGLLCYMVEEYPTADALEVERIPLPL